MSRKYLTIKNAKKVFKSKGISGKPTNTIAVDNISLDIFKGETLALVGESGSGKTTLGKGILNIEPLTSGSIFVEGKEKSILEMSKKEQQEVYSRMQIIFQDPYSSLNPRLSALDIVMEPLFKENKEEAKKKALDILEFVGISNEDTLKLSNTFSGGQRQRIGIARALAVDPEFIVCDEPVSALDVSIQAQVVNMFEDLQEELGLTYLFIAHDLSIVNHISSRIGVMYLGHLVELADSDTITFHSLHPYTKSLISAVPIADPKVARASQRIILSGDVPSPVNPPSGCPFRTRCPYADGLCAEQKPEFKEVESGHYAACHHLDRIH